MATTQNPDLQRILGFYGGDQAALTRDLSSGIQREFQQYTDALARYQDRLKSGKTPAEQADAQQYLQQAQTLAGNIANNPLYLSLFPDAITSLKSSAQQSNIQIPPPDQSYTQKYGWTSTPEQIQQMQGGPAAAGTTTPTDTTGQPPTGTAGGGAGMPTGTPTGTGGTTGASGQIPFRAGLTDQQKAGISQLASKPADQWTATDKANWSYATNNAPVPSGTGARTSQAGGAAPSPSQGQPGATPGAPSLSDQKTALTNAGIDVTGLSDNQVAYLAAFQNMMTTKAQNDQAVLPKQLTTDEMAKFMDQAKSELDPYYAEQLRVGTKDILDNFAQITQDTAYQSQQRQQAITDEQKAQAESMAEQGLTYSGLRKQAEQKLQTQEQGLVRSEASQVAKNLRSQAAQYEQTYGSQALSQLQIPALTYAGVQVQPYTPYGGLMGTQGKEQTTSEIQRQQQLAGQELTKRYGLAYPQVAQVP